MDRILKPDQLPPVLMIVDQRLAKVVSLQQACKGRVELQSDSQIARGTAEVHRVVAHRSQTAAEDDVQVGLQVVGVERHQSPAIDQRGAVVLPVEPVGPRDVQPLNRVEHDRLERDRLEPGPGLDQRQLLHHAV